MQKCSKFKQNDMETIMKIKRLITLLFIFILCLNLYAKQKEKTTVEHPMEYILDLSEIGDFKFLYNDFYGDAKKSKRQVCLNFTKFVRRNKPQIGDTVRITGVLTSPIDIDKLIVGIVDDSVSADYWMNLAKDGSSVSEQRKTPDTAISNIKAGEPYNLDVKFTIKQKMRLRFAVQLAYGEQNGKPCKMKVKRLCESYFGTTGL